MRCYGDKDEETQIQRGHSNLLKHLCEKVAVLLFETTFILTSEVSFLTFLCCLCAVSGTHLIREGEP